MKRFVFQAMAILGASFCLPLQSARATIPDPDWIAFYQHVDDVSIGAYFSPEFRTAIKQTQRPPVEESQVRPILSEVSEELIRRSEGLKLSGRDYPHHQPDGNELSITLNFSLANLTAKSPGDAEYLLMFSIDSEKIVKQGYPYLSPNAAQNFPHSLLISGDKEAFHTELRKVLVDAVTKAVMPAICFKRPENKICPQFFATYASGQINGAR